MNPEDEVRNLLGRAQIDSETSEQEWEVFMTKAHRSLAVRRGLLAAGAVVLVGLGAAGAMLLVSNPVEDPRPLPPAGSNEPSQEPEPTATETQVGEADFPYPSADSETGSVVQVWFVSGEEGDPVLTQTYRDIGEEPGVARAAIEALLSGPKPDEDTLASYVPEDTELLDITIENGTATVDFSTDFDETGLGSGFEHLPLAQVVWTLTQFDTVNSVVFEIEGDRVEAYGSHGLVIDKPQKRKDYEDNAPAIVVDFPFPGQQVGTRFDLEGNANVYEANVSWRVVDDGGEVLAEKFATATCGTGCRGTYRVTISVNVPGETEATIEVFESSAEDGSPMNMVRVPITIVP